MTGKERIVELESEWPGLRRKWTRSARNWRRADCAPARRTTSRGCGTAPARVIGWLVLALMTGAIGLAIGLMLRAEQASFTGLLNWQYNPEALPVSRELAACVVTALAALLFFAARRRLTFYALALLSVYLTYGFYSPRTGCVAHGRHNVFLLSKGFLAVGYLLMTLACIRESHAPQRRGRTAAFLSLVNSGVFLYLISEALERRLPHYQWVFLLVSGCVLSVLALLAETSGPRPNYMFRGSALQSLCAHHVVADCRVVGRVAVDRHGPRMRRRWAAAYQRSGIILLKLLNLLLLLITFVVCIASVKVPETVLLGDFTIPGNWLFGLGVPTVFAFLAVFYARVARPRSPAERRLSGQWFLAHTFLDVPAPTVAMWHAAAAALLLVTFTIINQGQHATLPAVLGR